jgi:hypothetical protein
LLKRWSRASERGVVGPIAPSSSRGRVRARPNTIFPAAAFPGFRAARSDVTILSTPVRYGCRARAHAYTLRSYGQTATGRTTRFSFWLPILFAAGERLVILRAIIQRNTMSVLLRRLGEYRDKRLILFLRYEPDCIRPSLPTFIMEKKCTRSCSRHNDIL